MPDLRGPASACLLALSLIGAIAACAPQVTPPPTPTPASTPPPMSALDATPSPRAPSADERAPYGTAVRLEVPFLGVDLAVIEGVMDAQGNPEFPLCDVAQYLPYYVQPGAIGTTYLYAHAREGMLLGLLEASEVNDGEAMLGETISVYTNAGWRIDYSIHTVRRHATDYTIADDLEPGEQRLIVQTSEGLVDDPNKLQVAAAPATFVEVGSFPVPTSQPRVCAPRSGG